MFDLLIFITDGSIVLFSQKMKPTNKNIRQTTSGRVGNDGVGRPAHGHGLMLMGFTIIVVWKI
jgi:hypothetical protein